MFPGSFASPLVQPEGTKRILLAEIRLSRAALYVDLLNVFSSAYDTYDVIAEGLYPTVAARTNIQFAVNGVVDTAANYYYVTDSAGSNMVAASNGYLDVQETLTTGFGLDFQSQFISVNRLTGLKRMTVAYTNEISVQKKYGTSVLCYAPAKAISGFRLKWESGTTFQAKGSVLVYGITRY